MKTWTKLDLLPWNMKKNKYHNYKTGVYTLKINKEAVGLYNRNYEPLKHEVSLSDALAMIAEARIEGFYLEHETVNEDDFSQHWFEIR